MPSSHQTIVVNNTCYATWVIAIQGKLQSKYGVIGTKYRRTKLSSVQIIAIQGWTKTIQPLSWTRSFIFLHPLRSHVNVIKLKQVNFQRLCIHLPSQLEVVVYINKVIQCFSINLVPLLRVNLPKGTPLPLEWEGTANLT